MDERGPIGGLVQQVRQPGRQAFQYERKLLAAVLPADEGGEVGVVDDV